MVEKIYEKTNGMGSFISQNKMQVFLLSLTTLITIANLYIASLLYPIKSDIQRIDAITNDNRKILNNRQQDIDSIDLILDKINGIDKRLERIENHFFK